MKFNFKKIVSVFTSTVMIASTVALAAAANAPAPFVNGGVANAAVVVGSSASADDMGAASVVKAYLDSQVTSSSAATVSGENIPLEKANSKLHLGQSVANIFTRSITNDDLATLLADGTFTNDNNDDFDYTQKVVVDGSLQFGMFSDSDYADSEPTLGVKVADGDPILTYTLDFLDSVPLADSVKNSDITILGKNYYVLDQANGSTKSLTLLDAAQTQTMSEGETKTVTVNGVSYEVTVTDVLDGTSSAAAKITVNGKATNKLYEGDTYKLSNGTYIGVKEVNYKSKDSATSNVVFSLGSGKLVLTNGASVEVNDETVQGLTADINVVSNEISSIDLNWIADNDQFITLKDSVSLPVFNSLKLSLAGIVFPSSEQIEVGNSGKYVVQLKAPIKDGDVSLDILHTNETQAASAKFATIGKDTDKRLSLNGTYDDNTENMIVSWADSDTSESYVLYATNFRNDSGVEKVTFKKRNDASFSKELKLGDQMTLGNAELNLSALNIDLKTATLNNMGDSQVTFDQLYTKTGANIDLSGLSVTGIQRNESITIVEEDKDDKIAQGNTTTVNLGLTSKGAVTVTGVDGTQAQEEIGDTNVMLGYVYSALATEVKHDTDPEQETATITYHGAESYGQLVLSETSATVGGSSGILIVKDNEASAMSGKNLVVVGGSCINTVAAKLLGSNTPLCGSAWESATGAGAGAFVINSYANEGKIATLVAGYNKADTEAAAQYLKTQTVDTSAGAVVKRTAATGAALV